MNDDAKTKQQLIDELYALRQQNAELQKNTAVPLWQADQKLDYLAKLQAIYYLGEMISQAETVAEIYETALNTIRLTLQAEAVAISLFQPNGQATFATWQGLSDNFLEAAPTCLPWSAMDTAPPPIFIPNIKIAPVSDILRDLLLAEGFRAISFVPLIYHNKLFGHLMFTYHQTHLFNEEELWVTQTIAGLVSFATERKRVELEQERLLKAEREQRLLAETLREVVLALTAQTSHEAVLDEVLHQVQRLTSYSTANIMLLEEETLYIARWQGNQDFGDAGLLTTLRQPLTEFPLDAQVIQTRQAMVVPDTGLNTDWVVMPESAWIRSFIAVPLCLQDRVLGLLRLDSHIPGLFSEQDTARLLPLANAAAIALENVQLREQAQNDLAERVIAEQSAFALNRKFLSLQYAGATIASSLNLQFVLNTFAREMVDLLQVEGCVISTWNQATDIVTVIGRHGPPQWWSARALDVTYPAATIPLTHWVLTERRSEQVLISQGDIDGADLAYMQDHQMETLLVLPMEFQNRVIGLIEAMDAQRERDFTGEEIAFTQLLANQAAAAIENARLYAKAQQEIAERKETEVELRRVAARDQVILAAIPDTMFYLNRAGELLDYQIYDEAEFPPPSKNMGREDLTEILWISPEVEAQALAAIQQALQTRKVQIFEYQRPGLFEMRDFEARLIASGENEVLTIVRNISDRKQAEHQLVRNERLAALGQLAAALAHEINNPLQAIHSNLDLMLRYPLAAHENEQYLNIIQRQIERVSDITRQMLDFARPHSVQRQFISLSEQIEQVLVLVGKQLEQHHIEVVVEADPNLPPAFAAPDQLNQVFLNLILNAIESIADKGKLSIALYQEQQELIISFTSDGPPIPPELLPHIFEPFFTTKPEGNGLGLWTSHSLIQQHDGLLTVENITQDQGVIFTVRLPNSL